MLSDPTVLGVLYLLATSLMTLVGVGIRAIYKGDLVPRKSVEFATDNWKQQLEEKQAEAADWKKHYEAERELGVNSRENREILLAVSKTMERVLSSLPTANDADVGG